MKKSERINFDTRRKSAKKIHHRFIYTNKIEENEGERAAPAEAAKRRQKPQR